MAVSGTLADLRADRRPAMLAVALLLVIGIGLAASIAFGAKPMPLATVFDAIARYGADDPDQQIVREVRLPRAVAALVVGACLAVGGAILQAITRNPLASPSILGLNAGAALGLAVAVIFFPALPFALKIVVSFAGAALGAVLVFGIAAANRRELTPLRLVLAGAAVTALLSAMTSGLVIFFGAAQQVLHWQAGGLGSVLWSQVLLVLPWLALGLCGAMAMARQFTMLGLGDEVASGLGQKVPRVRAIGILLVVMLAGAGVALAGPVGFIGLMVPHIVRYLVGHDYRLVIPFSALLGGLLMVAADLGARIVNPPYEVPAGFITALIGVPFFLALARRAA